MAPTPNRWICGDCGIEASTAARNPNPPPGWAIVTHQAEPYPRCGHCWAVLIDRASLYNQRRTERRD